MNVLLLVLAIIAEVSGAYALKYSEGMTKFWPSVWMLVFFTMSVTLLAFAIKRIDTGMGYAIWTGTGTALIAVIGIMFFKESVTWAKMISIGLIVAGVVGLNLSMKH
jgi:small multidrug resistance pump